MANGGGDGGRGPAAPRVPACPPELKCFFGCLVSLLRQMEAREHAFAVEHVRLLAEIEFLKREQSQRLEIARDTIQEIRRGKSLKDEMAKLLERKEPEEPGSSLDDLGDKYLESFRSLIITLTDENSELKKKLEAVEILADLPENTVDRQHSARDLRTDLRKLKQAYKDLVSKTDKEISSIRAEKDFMWNQFRSSEKDHNDICYSKNIEIKRANEAAEDLKKTVHELHLEVQHKDSEIRRLQAELLSAKDISNSENIDIKRANEAAEDLKKTVHELRLEVQDKDGEISRLEAEVLNAKENMLMTTNELEQMRSLVKNKYAETDQPETSKKWKKDLNEANEKSKHEGPVSKDKSRISQVTPVRKEVKTSRKSVSSAKRTHSQPGNNSRTRNTEEIGQSETSQKRKRGTHSLSHSLRRCSSRLQVKPVASPLLFTPCFTIPKLTVPGLPQH